MAKAYILQEKDFEELIELIARDPRCGDSGQMSSVAISQLEQQAHDQARRFFNYNIRRWIDRVRE